MKKEKEKESGSLDMPGNEMCVRVCNRERERERKKERERKRERKKGETRQIGLNESFARKQHDLRMEQFRFLFLSFLTCLFD